MRIVVKWAYIEWEYYLWDEKRLFCRKKEFSMFKNAREVKSYITMTIVVEWQSNGVSGYYS